MVVGNQYTLFNIRALCRGSGDLQLPSLKPPSLLYDFVRRQVVAAISSLEMGSPWN